MSHDKTPLTRRLILSVALCCSPVMCSGATTGKGKPPRAKVIPALVIRKLQHFGSPASGTVGMRGEATNPGRKPLANVMAVVVYVRDGKRKGSQSLVAFRRLAPKETREFNVSVKVDDPRGKYLIGFGLPANAPLNVVYPK